MCTLVFHINSHGLGLCVATLPVQKLACICLSEYFILAPYGIYSYTTYIQDASISK